MDESAPWHDISMIRFSS